MFFKIWRETKKCGSQLLTFELHFFGRENRVLPVICIFIVITYPWFAISSHVSQLYRLWDVKLCESLFLFLQTTRSTKYTMLERTCEVSNIWVTFLVKKAAVTIKTSRFFPVGSLYPIHWRHRGGWQATMHIISLCVDLIASNSSCIRNFSCAYTNSLPRMPLSWLWWLLLF